MRDESRHMCDIIEEVLIVCVDGSVKNENMGGHMCVRNEDATMCENKSICTNTWQMNTACAAEARIMLELFEMIKDKQIDKNYRGIQIMSDNKRLMSMINKTNHAANEMANDAGDIISRII